MWARSSSPAASVQRSPCTNTRPCWLLCCKSCWELPGWRGQDGICCSQRRERAASLPLLAFCWASGCSNWREQSQLSAVLLGYLLLAPHQPLRTAPLGPGGVSPQKSPENLAHQLHRGESWQCNRWRKMKGSFQDFCKITGWLLNTMHGTTPESV